MAEISESKLIKMVEEFPGLYDSSHQDFKNPIAISSMWEIVSKKCFMTVNDCNEKWKLLKNRYARSKPDTSWPHYESLKFLEPFIRRKRKNNDKFEENVEVEEGNKRDMPVGKKPKRDEVEAMKAFCNSLSADLMKLPSEKQISCKIDLMILIQKYMSANSECIVATTSTRIVPEMSDIFSQIEKKILNNTMENNDPDWEFLYCIRNLFSNMMSLRHLNEEMENILAAVVPIYEEDQYTHQSEESNDVVILDVPMEKEKEPIVTHFEKPEPKVNTIRPPHTINTLKNQILSNGVDENKKYCNICEVKIEDNSHIDTDAHIAASKRYHLPYGVFKLNPLLFKFDNNAPKCIPCEEKFRNKWDLMNHISRNKEKHKQHCITNRVPNPQYELFSIKRGVLTVGNSFSYCFMCNQHRDDKSHDEETHRQNLMKMRPFCRLLDEVYCYCCNKLFDAVKLAKHMNKKDHKLNYEESYERFGLTRKSTSQS